jgi:hypothetical protein
MFVVFTSSTQRFVASNSGGNWGGYGPGQKCSHSTDLKVPGIGGNTCRGLERPRGIPGTRARFSEPMTRCAIRTP